MTTTIKAWQLTQTVYVVLVWDDAGTTTFQSDGWERATLSVLMTIDDPFYRRDRAVRIFMATTAGTIEEHTPSNMKADLAAGTPQAADKKYADEYQAKMQAAFSVDPNPEPDPQLQPLASCYACERMTDDAAEAAAYRTVTVDESDPESGPSADDLVEVFVCPNCSDAAVAARIADEDDDAPDPDRAHDAKANGDLDRS